MNINIEDKIDIDFISIFSENKKEPVQLVIPLVKYNTFGNQHKQHKVTSFEEGVTHEQS